MGQNLSPGQLVVNDWKIVNKTHADIVLVKIESEDPKPSSKNLTLEYKETIKVNSYVKTKNNVHYAFTFENGFDLLGHFLLTINHSNNRETITNHRFAKTDMQRFEEESTNHRYILKVDKFEIEFKMTTRSTTDSNNVVVCTQEIVMTIKGDTESKEKGDNFSQDDAKAIERIIEENKQSNKFTKANEATEKKDDKSIISSKLPSKSDLSKITKKPNVCCFILLTKNHH
jgi:hypothetical protein